MKKIKSDKDLKDIRTCDIELISMNWVNDGRDLELIFLANDVEKSSFLCTWANNIKTHFTTNPNEVGCPFTWDITLKENDDNVFEVEFDFASKGNVSLCCNELKYNIF